MEKGIIESQGYKIHDSVLTQDNQSAMQMEYTEESEYILQGPEGSELLKLYGTNKGLK